MNVAGITETTQYLTFELDREVFAVEIGKVREVLDFTRVTRVPKMPDFLRGVINLRGSVVPVADLRLKFGMSEAQETVNTCIVVMEIDLDGEPTVLGALADSVQEVLELPVERIEAPPKIGTRLKPGFIKGMGKRDDDFIIILDIDRIFSTDEITTALEKGMEQPGSVPVAGEGAAL